MPSQYQDTVNPPAIRYTTRASLVRGALGGGHFPMIVRGMAGGR